MSSSVPSDSDDPRPNAHGKSTHKRGRTTSNASTTHNCSTSRRSRTRSRSQSSSRSTSRVRSNSASRSRDSPSLRKKRRTEESLSDDEAAAASTDKKKLFKNMPPQEQLEYHQKIWKSDVYKHFRVKLQDDGTLNKDGRIVYEFHCRYTKKILRRHNEDTSTKNLKNHVDKCLGAGTGESGPIDAFASKNYTRERLRALITLWVSRRKRAFKILEDPELLDIFEMLNRNAVIPHRTTVSRDIVELHDYIKVRVKEMLQKHEGAFHLGLDTWLSGNKMSFLGVTVHYVQDDEMKKFTLDFIRLTERHTGSNLAKQVANLCKDFGISNKLLGTVCDNAANNDTMETFLGNNTKLPNHNGQLSRARCFAHTLNLVLKAFTSPFRSSSSKKKADADDDILMSQAHQGDSDSDSDEDDDGCGDDANNCVDSEDEGKGDGEDKEGDRVVEETEDMVRLLPLLPEEAREAKAALSKLTKIVKRIHYSDTLRTDLNTHCKTQRLNKISTIPRDVRTRWNSTTVMIKAALEVRKPIDILCVQHSLPSLSASEWDLLASLEVYLSVFLEATETFSQGNVPLLCDVIPAMDALQDVLDEVRDNEALPSVLRHGAARASIILSKYYSKTDDSEIYRIAMLLNPQYKSKYWSAHGWQADWIAAGIQCARDAWEKGYAPKPPPTVQPIVSKQQQTQSNRRTLFGPRAPSATAALPSRSLTPMVSLPSQFETWVSTPPFPAADPIKYWSNELKGSSKELARMALDYLSIPAASVDVKRAFSAGGLYVTDRRHRLSDKSIRAGILVGSWSLVEGLVSEAELVNMMKVKIDRKKRKGKAKKGKGIKDRHEVIDIDED